ncbi:hypothetical protein BGX27_007222 [Mortierella sp. AM989]|nr:hypothetical protein BGX27_007222 [Mortierella sp. AM989]
MSTQVAPVPGGELAKAPVKDNNVDVRVPVKADVKNVKVLSRALVKTPVKDNNVDIKVPVKADVKNVKVLSHALVNAPSN